MQMPFPEVAARGFAAARQFRDGAMSSDELAKTLAGCWQYLDAKKASTDFKTPEHCIIRAVVWPLYNGLEPGENVGDVIHMFLHLANKFEDQSETAEPLLRKHFLENKNAK